MKVFNLVILLALGDRLLRAETETVEDDEGNLIVRDIPGSSRERVCDITTNTRYCPDLLQLRLVPRLHRVAVLSTFIF